MSPKSMNFGSYHSWSEVSTFSSISEDAYALFGKLVRRERSRLTNPLQELFLRLGEQASTTSMALRLVNSWAMTLPALALLRVRVEQTIVCSYLVHEDSERGLRPFVHHGDIRDYRILKSAADDELLATQLAGIVNLDKVRERAIDAQARLSPDFDPETGAFQRKWTNLDLRTMAKRRDQLIRRDATLKRHPLERIYLSYYALTSSVVHCDVSSVSKEFMEAFQVPGRPPVLMAHPMWAISAALGAAHCDIIQCLDLLKWLQLDADEECDVLFSRWIEAKKHAFVKQQKPAK